MSDQPPSPDPEPATPATKYPVKTPSTRSYTWLIPIVTTVVVVTIVVLGLSL